MIWCGVFQSNPDRGYGRRLLFNNGRAGARDPGIWSHGTQPTRSGGATVSTSSMEQQLIRYSLNSQAVVCMADSPFPGLEDLRDKYRSVPPSFLVFVIYSISWKSKGLLWMRGLTVSSLKSQLDPSNKIEKERKVERNVTRRHQGEALGLTLMDDDRYNIRPWNGRGMRFLYGDDDTDDTEDEEKTKATVATVFGLASVFKNRRSLTMNSLRRQMSLTSAGEKSDRSLSIPIKNQRKSVSRKAFKW